MQKFLGPWNKNRSPGVGMALVVSALWGWEQLQACKRPHWVVRGLCAHSQYSDTAPVPLRWGQLFKHTFLLGTERLPFIFSHTFISYVYFIIMYLLLLECMHHGTPLLERADSVAQGIFLLCANTFNTKAYQPSVSYFVGRHFLGQQCHLGSMLGPLTWSPCLAPGESFHHPWTFPCSLCPPCPWHIPSEHTPGLFFCVIWYHETRPKGFKKFFPVPLGLSKMLINDLICP